MLSVGGVSVSGSNITTRPCDWQKKGVNALDVSTMTWSSKYNKTTDRYAIPAALVSAIGGR